MTVFDLLEEREATPDSIGPTLRRAREAVGYSVSDVAERMRLNRHQIENLEAERFELFPVSVFLRGYLTSYARLVGIDAEPLLDAYDRRGFGPPQLHSKEDTERTTGRGSELTVTVTTVVVIAVLIVLSALWWRDQWTGDGGPPGAAVVQPDEGGAPRGAEASLPAVGPGSEEPPARDDAAEAADLEPPPAAGDEEPPPVPAGGRASDASTEAEAAPGTGADAGASAEGGPRRGEGAEGPAEPAAPASPETIAGEGAEPEPDPPGPAQARAPDPSAEAAGSSPGGEGKLASVVIRVREDCWLMIRDAGERLIYRDLAAAGTVLELAAEPPIGIVAGYASGIEIEYDGEPFDLSPYVEQDTGTARFRLGS